MGAFTDFLEFIDRPGQVVRNLISGNIEGAFRQSASFAGDILDVALPFDMIPDFARDEDKIFGSDLVGLDEDSHGAARFGADLAIGILTDPITYLTGGFSAIGKVAAGAARASKFGAASATAGKAAQAAKVAVAKTKAGVIRQNITAHKMAAQGIPQKQIDKVISKLTPEEQTMSKIIKARTSANAKLRRINNEVAQIKDGIAANKAGDIVMGRSVSGARLTKLRGKPATQTEAATGEIGALKQLKEAQHDMDVLTGKVAKATQEKILAVEGLKVARESLPDLIESSVTNTARRALKKQGPLEMPALISRVTLAIGNDVSKANIAKVLGSAEFKGSFNQGGLRIGIPFGASKEIFSAEQISRAIGKVGNVLDTAHGASLAKLAPFVPKRIKKDFTGDENLIKKIWAVTKSTAGWDFFDSATRKLRRLPQAAGAKSAKVGLEAIGLMSAGTTAQTRNVVSQVFDNLAYQAGKPVGLLVEGGGQKVDDLFARLKTIQDNPALTDMVMTGDDWAKAKQIIGELDHLNKRQWDELINVRAVGQRTSPENAGAVAAGHMDTPPAANQGRQSFLMRVYDGKRTDNYANIMNELDGVDEVLTKQIIKAFDKGAEGASTLKKRTLDTDQDLLNFLSSPGAPALERDFAVRATRRAHQQGSVVARADLTSRILRDSFVILNDGTTAGAVQTVINNLSIADPKMAQWIQDTYNGIKPREFSKILATLNRVFKPAAVYGIGIPRMAAMTRNEIGGIFQLAATLGPDQVLRESKNLGRALYSSVTKGWSKLTGKGHNASKGLNKDVAKLDDAFLKARGDVVELNRQLANEPLLREALDNGVLNSFVSSEELLTKIARTPGMIKIQSFMDMPGEMFQHLEAMLRLGLFKDLRAGGMSATRAGEMVADTFLDYSVKSLANRRMRDIIPFAAFISQSIPQQAKLIANRPWVAVALSQMFKEDDKLPGFLQEQATIPFGKDAEGNPLVLSSLGLPVESLDVIPNFSDSPIKAGRQFEKEIIGSSQPLLKTGFSLATGRDPFFGTPSFTFDKAPQFLQALGADERGEAGRLFNIGKGLGVTQPLVTPINQFEKAVDPRKTAFQKTLALITGINIATVNPESAAVNNIRQDLLNNRSIGQSINFFSRAEDAESQALIDGFNQARARLRKKKQDAAIIDQ